MKKIALLITCIALAGAPASAQSLLERLGNRAKNAAENNVGNKVEKGVNDILDGNVGKKEKTKDTKHQQEQPVQQLPENKVSQMPVNQQPQQSLPVPATESMAAQPATQINPYLSTDKPSHSIPLGLPQNNNSPAPTGMPAQCVSYCAYQFDPVNEQVSGAWSKVFYNAANGRKFTITYHSDGSITKYLSIPDSLAFYKIDDEKKLITKNSVKNGDTMLQGMDDMFESKTNRTTSGGIIESCDGRWCYRQEHVSTATLKDGSTDKNVSYSFYDMETGIMIREDGGNQNFLRGIQLGLFHPELFELPEGYKMQELDMMKAIEMMMKMKNQ